MELSAARRATQTARQSTRAGAIAASRLRRQRGLSMTEVALALLLLSTLLVGWFQTRAATTRRVDERNLAQWIDVYADATRRYLEDHADKIVAEADDGVLDIAAKLAEGNYVAEHWLPERADGRSIRTVVRARCVDSQCALRQAEGLVAVVGGEPLPRKTLGSIANRVPFGGGTVDDRGQMAGVAGSWQSTAAEWNSIPQASRPVAMVFTLPKLAHVMTFPAISDLHYEPQSAARSQERDGGKWQPLYTTDTMRVTWQAKNVQRARLEVIGLDESEKIYETRVLEGQTSYIVEPVPNMFGKNIVVRVTPLSDDVEALRAEATEPIAVTDYDGAPVKKVSLKYKVWTASDKRHLSGVDYICIDYGELFADETNMFVGLERIQTTAPNGGNVPPEARYLRQLNLEIKFDGRRAPSLAGIKLSHGSPQPARFVFKLSAPNDTWETASVPQLEKQQRIRGLVYDCRTQDAFDVDIRASINGAGKPHEVLALKNGYLRQPFASIGPPTEHSFKNASEIPFD